MSNFETEGEIFCSMIAGMAVGVLLGIFASTCFWCVIMLEAIYKILFIL